MFFQTPRSRDQPRRCEEESINHESAVPHEFARTRAGRLADIGEEEVRFRFAPVAGVLMGKRWRQLPLASENGGVSCRWRANRLTF